MWGLMDDQGATSVRLRRSNDLSAFRSRANALRLHGRPDFLCSGVEMLCAELINYCKLVNSK